MAAPNCAEETAIPIPCKINLFLQVGPRRADGYHDIETFFLPVPEPADAFYIRRFDEPGDIDFTCSDPELETDDNLVVRAYRAFASRTGFAPRLEVGLKKTHSLRRRPGRRQLGRRRHAALSKRPGRPSRPGGAATRRGSPRPSAPMSRFSCWDARPWPQAGANASSRRARDWPASIWCWSARASVLPRPGPMQPWTPPGPSGQERGQTS